MFGLHQPDMALGIFEILSNSLWLSLYAYAMFGLLDAIFSFILISSLFNTFISFLSSLFRLELVLLPKSVISRAIPTGC